jgi:hypothetical protein
MLLTLERYELLSALYLALKRESANQTAINIAKEARFVKNL